jgi:hypothetical protein
MRVRLDPNSTLGLGLDAWGRQSSSSRERPERSGAVRLKKSARKKSGTPNRAEFSLQIYGAKPIKAVRRRRALAARAVAPGSKVPAFLVEVKMNIFFRLCDPLKLARLADCRLKRFSPKFFRWTGSSWFHPTPG